MSIDRIKAMLVSMHKQYVHNVCSILDPYIGSQCTTEHAYAILLLFLIGIAIVYWLFIHAFTVRLFRSLFRIANRSYDRLRMYVTRYVQGIYAFVKDTRRRRLRMHVPVDIGSEQVSYYIASIQDARKHQYENLIRLLELSLRNEAVQITKELLMLKEESQLFGRGQTQDTGVSPITVTQQTNTYDVLMEQLLENCVKRVRLRFDNNSWQILCLAYGSEHNLIQYIKDRVIDHMLGAVNTLPAERKLEF